jgi:3-hydroxyacyl-[acyl-carrier-protein] dehydratase
MHMINSGEILKRIPHAAPFRFIDDLSFFDTERISGSYTFRADEYFFKGHFPERPVVPGFVVTECMSQIGLAAFGVFLELEKAPSWQVPPFFLCDAQCDFFEPVFPGDTLHVRAEKIYFRLHKLRCNIAAVNQHGKKICTGVFSGMSLKNNES